MKTIKYIALVMALAFLASCATTFKPWKLSEVQEGMERSQVVRLLGEPDLVETQNGEEHLHYSYRESYNPPMAADSVYEYDATREDDWESHQKQMEKSFKKNQFIVILLDGKVMNYKEVQD